MKANVTPIPSLWVAYLGLIGILQFWEARKWFGHLRQAEILISEEKTVAEVLRGLGVSEQTYYRWRKEYSGMEVQQLRRLKELEQ